MRYLTLEQVLQLHVIAIRHSGGTEGIRDLGRIESVIAAQRQAVFGEELYVTVYEKAAAIVRGIIADHPFIDGNKRTGMLAALTFLRVNNYSFTAKTGELEDFAVKIATEKLDVKVIAAWFKRHSTKK